MEYKERLHDLYTKSPQFINSSKRKLILKLDRIFGILTRVACVKSGGLQDKAFLGSGDSVMFIFDEKSKLM